MRDIEFDNVSLGFVVELQLLKKILKDLSVDGRTMWVSSDPQDAGERGYLSIGFGVSKSHDRLNTIYFQVPVVSSVVPKYHRARLVLLLDPSYVTVETPGFYNDEDSIVQDAMEDFVSFFRPLNKALAARIQSDD